MKNLFVQISSSNISRDTRYLPHLYCGSVQGQLHTFTVKPTPATDTVPSRREFTNFGESKNDRCVNKGTEGDYWASDRSTSAGASYKTRHLHIKGQRMHKRCFPAGDRLCVNTGVEKPLSLCSPKCQVMYQSFYRSERALDIVSSCMPRTAEKIYEAWI